MTKKTTCFSENCYELTKCVFRLFVSLDVAINDFFLCCRCGTLIYFVEKMVYLTHESEK